MAGSDLIFPPGFLWGSATSAHQVEGGNQNNDWWDWERLPGHIRDGSTSGLACDHYHRYRTDWALARDLGHNAHRLSIEWSRIEPQEGMWDDVALAHYRDVVLSCRSCGLEPIVTLHHFTNPRWFVARGGWQNPAAIRLFCRYVARVVTHLADVCTLWVTINEPMVYFYEGYLTRRWPPGKGGVMAGLRSVRTMLQAHGRAYRFIHTIQPEAQVGVAHNMRLFDPANPRSRLDRAAAGAEDRIFNRVVLWALLDGYLRSPLGRGQFVAEAAHSLDFIGLNYYTRDMVSFALRGRGRTGGIARNAAQPGTATDDFGWEIYPDGLYRLLNQVAIYGKPIYVTEHGLADGRDTRRPAYLVRSVAAMWRAIQEGAPVRGYLHWSLMDNFEWAEGYGMQFGLVSVDGPNKQRVVKHSGQVYEAICRANGLPADLLAKYAPELVIAETP